MVKILPVISNQSDAIGAMANQKKVSRAKWQRAHDDGRFAKFLDSLKEPVPPPGCRMHILSARVLLDQPWQEAVNDAGPNTPADYNVRKVGKLYVPTGTGEEERDYILLNWPKGCGNWDKAFAWAGQEELVQTVPREAFAIGRQYSTLHTTLGVNPMYVVATTPCTFGGDQQACYVWLYDALREALLFRVSLFGSSSDWFLFRKSLASVT